MTFRRPTAAPPRRRPKAAIHEQTLIHGGTVGTDPVAGQSQRGRRRGQPAAEVPIVQVWEQKWHRCRALLGRLAALRQQGRLSAGDLGDVEVLRQHIQYSI